MKTLRDYEALIRAKVEEINKADEYWTFSVKSFAKNHVRIRWGYLDYLREKENCFNLELVSQGGDLLLYATTPGHTTISGYIINDSDGRRFWEDSFEDSIKYAIHAIADYAHSVY